MSQSLKSRAVLLVGSSSFVVVWPKSSDKSRAQLRRPAQAQGPVFGSLFQKIAISRLQPQPRHDDALRRPDPAALTSSR
jgi:hypothetical protein